MVDTLVENASFQHAHQMKSQTRVKTINKKQIHKNRQFRKLALLKVEQILHWKMANNEIKQPAKQAKFYFHTTAIRYELLTI
ncbi:hypothetical protein K0M31_007770 [Melipona bicolor]|uniref:Uncharacterized protein n=1 Tax=Melipona bicolor TaxID=60889 RepID=A0AA40KVY6_9HYME|nr:hypothetical protein K0M31_007770 [Melipona bicolor]